MAQPTRRQPLGSRPRKPKAQPLGFFELQRQIEIAQDDLSDAERFGTTNDKRRARRLADKLAAQFRGELRLRGLR
ncbi:hypothetical protein LCGC14_2935120 [marine sediment metagenome]|uniref:Uncharacterized protein n=1 Tax=marine sediment metagenome TaxID=412755 RepID=A0A0F8XJL8_9ZZZZ